MIVFESWSSCSYCCLQHNRAVAMSMYFLSPDPDARFFQQYLRENFNDEEDPGRDLSLALILPENDQWSAEGISVMSAICDAVSPRAKRTRKPLSLHEWCGSGKPLTHDLPPKTTGTSSCPSPYVKLFVQKFLGDRLHCISMEGQ